VKPAHGEMKGSGSAAHYKPTMAKQTEYRGPDLIPSSSEIH